MADEGCPSPDAYVSNSTEFIPVSAAAAGHYCAWAGGRLPSPAELAAAVHAGAVSTDASEHTHETSVEDAPFRCLLAPGPFAPAWDRPLCVGYAAATETYSCLAFAVSDESGEVLGSSDVEVMFELLTRQGLQDAVWWGERSFIEVGPSEHSDQPRLLLSQAVLDERGVPAFRRERTYERAVTEMHERGYQDGVHTIPLFPGRWHRVAGRWVWVTPRYRSGGGVSEHLAYDVVVADRRGPQTPVGRPEGRAPGATWAFAAPEAQTFVVATIEWHGGEGTGGIATSYQIHRAARE